MLHGGRGGAKSTEVAKALVHHARKRKEVIVCARQFQNSIDASSKALIEQMITAEGCNAEFKFTEHTITHVKTGSTFSFIGLERNIQSIKSMTGVTIIWFEEAEVIKLVTLNVLLPTIRSFGSRFIWTYNPDREVSPVDDMFRNKDAELPENTVIFGVNVEQNKYLYRTRMPSEMRTHWHRKQKTFKHVWRGDYNRNSEARVFQNVQVGTIDVPPRYRPTLGMDFGHNDPQTKLPWVEDGLLEFTMRRPSCGERDSLRATDRYFGFIAR